MSSKSVVGSVVALLVSVFAVLTLVAIDGDQTSPPAPLASEVLAKGIAAGATDTRDPSLREPKGKIAPVRYVPDQLVVRFKRGATATERAAARRSIGAHLKRKLTVERAELLALEKGTSVEEAAKRIERNRAIDFSEPNYLVTTTNTPNDPYFSDLWGLHNTGQNNGTPDADIDAPEAWDTQTGGDDVTVAVVDTGVDYGHEDLTDSIWVNDGENGIDQLGNSERTNGLDDDNNGYEDDWRGYDFANRDTDPMDDAFHGTHVAGTIAGEGNNGVGVTGVSWNANIMPLKFLGANGSGTISDGAEALDYAGANGADVVNGSFGYTANFYSQLERAAIEAHPDTLYVFSAGNSGLDNDDEFRAYPCSHPSDNIICVGATSHDDDRANYWNWGSNYGQENVDVFAPGVNILSAKASFLTEIEGKYVYASGTSMAAPHVAGAAAVLKSQNLAATADDLKRALMDGVDEKPNLAGQAVTGGRINLVSSLQEIYSATTGSTVAIDNDRVVVRGDRTVAHDIDITQSGGEIVVADITTPLTAGAECTSLDANHVSCPDSGIAALKAVTGDSPDTIVNATGLPSTLRTLGGADTITGGAGDDRLDGGSGNDTISGGDGQDTVDYSSHSAPVTITLDGQANDGSDGETDDIQSDIENVIGGSNADHITGDENTNYIFGGAGGDILEGGAGNDTLDGGTGGDTIEGGDGTDVADYSAAFENVTLSIDGVANDGRENEGDAIGYSIENLVGGIADDTLSGSYGANEFDGGDGIDSVSYAGRSAHVEVSLDETDNDGADGEHDNVGDSIEQLTGGNADDTLVGDTDDNILDGGLGGDELFGGGGEDTVSYKERSVGVEVTIGTGKDDGQPGEEDDVHGDVENLTGGYGDDLLTGDAGDNKLDGGQGDDDDVLSGGDGDDIFVKHYDADLGGDGADIMQGGAGLDTADYSDVATGGQINLKITLDGIRNDGPNGWNGVSSEADNIDTDVENVNGGDGTDEIYGNELANRLIGDVGPDKVYGEGGNDYLSGDGGTADRYLDYCSSKNFADIVEGGPGDDVIYGGGTNNDVRFNGGRDSLKGGDGDDRISTTWDDVPEYPCGNFESSEDIVEGGAGSDMADFSQWNVETLISVDGLPRTGWSQPGTFGDPRVNGATTIQTDVENVLGGTRGDRIYGSDAANMLNGRDGDDIIVGAGGVDEQIGGEGVDLLLSAGDGEIDHDSCGNGTDSVNADATDTVDADCEAGAVTEVSAANGEITVTGAPGVSSAIYTWYYYGFRHSLSVLDNGRPVIAGPGCDQITGGAVGCDAAGVNKVTINAGDENDHLIPVDNLDPQTISYELNGGSGNDYLAGSGADDVLDGGPGDDQLYGNDGEDTAGYGDHTDPVLAVLAQSGQLTQNNGSGAENDLIDGSVENLNGGSGNDTLTGNGSANTLFGGPGEDTIAGGDGNDNLIGGDDHDTLSGDNGNDSLRSADAGPDDVDCGADDDNYVVDVFDTLDADCEGVAVEPDTTITGGPDTDEATLDDQPLFSLASDSTGATFECKFDAGAFAPCPARYHAPPLSDGTHTLYARAVDFGLVDQTPATWTFTVDDWDNNVQVSPPGPHRSLIAVTNAGTQNHLTVENYFNAFHRVNDSLQPLDSGPGCGNITENLVQCWNVPDQDNIQIDVGGENDVVVLEGDVEFAATIEAGDGDDDVTGGGGDDTINGGSGADIIAGGSGSDAIDAGEGDDTVNSRDHVAETVHCGDGTDSVTADAEDTIENCENVAAIAETSIMGAPSDPSNSSTLTWFFQSDEPSTFECSFDQGAFEPCESPYVIYNVSEGDHDFAVRAVDGRGNADTTPAEDLDVTVDLTAPLISISAPAGVVTDSTPVANFAVNDAFSGVASVGCFVDGGSFSPCFDGVEVPEVDNGTHQLMISAVDRAGNSATAVQNFEAAATEPNTRITVGPEDPTETNDLSWGFAATVPSTFECSFDGGAFASCSSPFVANDVSEGDHDFVVRATSLLGVPDPTPAEDLDVTVDTLSPHTTITAGPADGTTTDEASATYEFTSDRPLATFECKLDDAEFSPCSSPWRAEYLYNGSHTIAVRAIDGSSMDQSPATRTIVASLPSWLRVGDVNFVSGQAVDLTAVGLVDWAHWGLVDADSFNRKSQANSLIGDISLVGEGAVVTREPDSGFEFSWSNGDPVAGVTNTSAGISTGGATGRGFNFTVPTQSKRAQVLRLFLGVRNTDVKLTAGFSPSWTSTWGANSGLKLSTVDITVRAGWSSQDLEMTLEQNKPGVDGRIYLFGAVLYDTPDTTPPDTLITGGPAEGETTGTTTPSFTFEGDEWLPSYQCKYDNDDYLGCYISSSRTLEEGPHTFRVRGIDDSGNVDTTPAVRHFTVDTTAPETSIDTGPSGPTGDTTPEFTFHSEPAGDATQFECRIVPSGGSVAWAPCSGAVAAGSGSHVADLLVDGDYTFEVRGTDALGHVEQDPATSAFSVDTVGPETTIDSSPDDPTGASDLAWTFSASESGTFECSFDGSTFAACASPFEAADATDGDHDFAVRAVDSVGNPDATPAEDLDVTVDTLAPDLVVTDPSGAINDQTPVTHFSADDGAGSGVSGFECSVDGSPFVACNDGDALEPLADGTHTLTVRATDVVGNAATAGIGFTVDTVAPVTAIDDQPSDPTNDNDLTWSFSADETASFECSLDGGPFDTCASPYTAIDVPDGDHNFAVRAIDEADNSDASPAEDLDVTVDTVAPDTSIDAGPADGATIDEAAATYEFSSSDASATFECRVDGAAYHGCDAPWLSDYLSSGSHNIFVRAVDTAGNADATPATRAIVADLPGRVDVNYLANQSTVDLTQDGELDWAHWGLDGAESVNRKDTATSIVSDISLVGDGTSLVQELTGGPTLSWTDGSPMVAQVGTSTGVAAGGASGRGISLTIDGSPERARVARFYLGAQNTSALLNNVAPGGSWSASFSGGATMEMTTFDVTFRGELPGPTLTSTIAQTSNNPDGKVVLYGVAIRESSDVTPPDTTILTAPEDGGWTADSTPSFNFSSNEPSVQFRCKVDAGSYGYCYPGISFGPLSDGVHTVKVRASDGSGNVDTTPATRTFSIDATPPDTQLDAVPPVQSSDTTPDFAFHGTPAGDTAAYECRLYPLGAPVAWGSCSGGNTHSAGALADGAYTFETRAVDALGNSDASPAAHDFVIDTAGTNIQIVSPSDGQLVSTTPALVSFTDDGSAVSTTCSIDGNAPQPCSSPLSVSGEGVHSVVVEELDLAGNPSADSVSFSVDSIDPQVELTQTPPNPTHDNTPAVEFTATDTAPSSGIAALTCEIDDGGQTPCSSPFETPQLADGQHTIAVRAVDNAGHVGADSTTFVVDTAAPDTVIDPTPPAAFINQTDASFDFHSTEPGSTFECQLDGAGYSPCVSPQSYASLSANASHMFEVRATDGAGNTDLAVASHSWTIDTLLPVVSITAPAAASVTADMTPPATFSVSDANLGPASSTTCEVSGATTVAAYACTSGADLPSLSSGTNTLTVRHTDKAGNVGSAAVSFDVDAVAPSIAIAAPANGSSTTDNTPALSYAVSDAHPSSPSSTTCEIAGATAVAVYSCASGTDLPPLNAGSHTLTIRHTDTVGNPGVVTSTFTVLNQQLLSATVITPPSGTHSLTAEGPVDWSHWGRSSASDWDHKSSGGSQISNVAAHPAGGTTLSRVTSSVAPKVSWTDGSPTASNTGTNSGVTNASSGIGKGFSLSVGNVQNTEAMTLRLHVGLLNCRGQLELFWSSTPGTIITDTSISTTSTTTSANRIYQITLRPPQPNDTLNVRWTQNTSPSSSTSKVRIYSASLAKLGVSRAAAPTTADLTTDGAPPATSIDWAHWGGTGTSLPASPLTPIAKAGGTEISNATQQVSGTLAQATSTTYPVTTAYSWSNGDTTPTASNIKTGLVNATTSSSSGRGFSFTVPAAASNMKTLKLYVGARNSSTTSAQPAKLELYWGSSTIPAFVDVVPAFANATTNYVYTINLRHVTAGTLLKVKWSTNTTSSSHRAVLQSAVLLQN